MINNHWSLPSSKSLKAKPLTLRDSFFRFSFSSFTVKIDFHIFFFNLSSMMEKEAEVVIIEICYSFLLWLRFWVLGYCCWCMEWIIVVFENWDLWDVFVFTGYELETWGSSSVVLDWEWNWGSSGACFFHSSFRKCWCLDWSISFKVMPFVFWNFFIGKMLVN